MSPAPIDQQQRPIFFVKTGEKQGDDGAERSYYGVSALEGGFVGIGYGVALGDRREALDENAYQQIVDGHKQKIASQVALFLGAKEGDRVVLMEGMTPIWLGTFQVLGEVSERGGAPIGHTLRPVVWEEELEVDSGGHKTVIRRADVVAQAKTNPMANRGETFCNAADRRFVDAVVQWLDATLRGNGDELKAFKRERKSLVYLLTIAAYRKGKSSLYLEGNPVKALLGLTSTRGRGGSTTPAKDRSGTKPAPERDTGLAETLRIAKNVVLEGVPGTGKTYGLKHHIASVWAHLPSGRARSGTAGLKGQGAGQYAITLHPATAYEDFVEGLRPVVQTPGGDSACRWVRHAEAVSAEASRDLAKLLGDESGPFTRARLEEDRYFHLWQADIHGVLRGERKGPGTTFAMHDGFFLRVCAEAVNNPDHEFLVLLDEINRCNVPKVMGDLLTTIERSKRARWRPADGKGAGYWDLSRCQEVVLPGSKRRFFVPENVYVVATMNSTDRSVAPLDAALRRRFAFVRCWPTGFADGDEGGSDADVPARVLATFKGEKGSPIKAMLEAGGRAAALIGDSIRAWATLNKGLSKAGPDALLGHSYLFDLAEDLGDSPRDPSRIVRHHWDHHILPQLAESLVANHLDGWLKPDGELSKLRVDGCEIKASHTPERGLQVPVIRLVGLRGREPGGEWHRTQKLTVLEKFEIDSHPVRLVQPEGGPLGVEITGVSGAGTSGPRTRATGLFLRAIASESAGVTPSGFFVWVSRVWTPFDFQWDAVEARRTKGPLERNLFRAIEKADGKRTRSSPLLITFPSESMVALEKLLREAGQGG